MFSNFFASVFLGFSSGLTITKASFSVLGGPTIPPHVVVGGGANFEIGGPQFFYLANMAMQRCTATSGNKE
jgi:hypothetical protein